MNVFAGNITLDGKSIINLLEFDYIESFSIDGNKTIFVFGETKMSSFDELIKFFTDKFGELISHDLSINTQEKIEVYSGDYEEGIYELVSFEGEQVSFKEIKDRFSETPEVISIREAGISKKFGNKIIKVDFVY